MRQIRELRGLGWGLGAVIVFAVASGCSGDDAVNPSGVGGGDGSVGADTGPKTDGGRGGGAASTGTGGKAVQADANGDAQLDGGAAGAGGSSTGAGGDAGPAEGDDAAPDADGALGTGGGGSDVPQEGGAGGASGIGGSNSEAGPDTTPDATGAGGAQQSGAGGAPGTDGGAGQVGVGGAPDTDGGAGQGGGGGAPGTGGGAGQGGVGGETGPDGSVEEAGLGGADGGPDSGEVDALADVYDAAAVTTLCTFDYSTSDAGYGNAICNWEPGSTGGTKTASTEDQSGSANPGALQFTTNFTGSSFEARVRGYFQTAPTDWSAFHTVKVWLKVVAPGTADAVTMFVGNGTGANANRKYGDPYPMATLVADANNGWVQLSFDITGLESAVRSAITSVGVEISAPHDAGTLTNATVLIDSLTIE